jgi:hypothetical protein
MSVCLLGFMYLGNLSFCVPLPQLCLTLETYLGWGLSPTGPCTVPTRPSHSLTCSQVTFLMAYCYGLFKTWSKRHVLKAWSLAGGAVQRALDHEDVILNVSVGVACGKKRSLEE